MQRTAAPRSCAATSRPWEPPHNKGLAPDMAAAAIARRRRSGPFADRSQGVAVVRVRPRSRAFLAVS